MYFIIIANFFCHYNENEVKLSFSDDFFIDFSLRFPSSAPFCSRYSLRRIPKGIFPRAEFSQMLILCPTLHQGTSDNSICCARTKKREKTPRFSRRRFRASAGLFTKKHTPLFFPSAGSPGGALDLPDESATRIFCTINAKKIILHEF